MKFAQRYVDTRLSRCAYIRLTFISIRDMCVSVCGSTLRMQLRRCTGSPPYTFLCGSDREAYRMHCDFVFLPNLIASLRFLGDDDSGRDRDQDSSRLRRTSSHKATQPPPLSNLSHSSPGWLQPPPFLRSPFSSFRACRFSLFLIGYMTRQLL